MKTMKLEIDGVSILVFLELALGLWGIGDVA